MRRIELVSNSGEVIRLDAAPFYVGQDVVLPAMPRVQVASTARVGMGGRRAHTRRHDTSDVRLPVQVLASTEVELDAAVGRLAKAVDPVVGDVVVRVYRADGTAREMVATYVDGMAGLTIASSRSREAQVPLVLEALEPYWRSVDEREQDILATEFIGGGEPTPFSADIPFSAPIPFSGFNETGIQEFFVGLAGDVEVWPRWEMAGPATQLTAVNQTTGKKWSYALSLASDVPLVIDTERKTVELDDVNAWSSLTDDSTLWPLVPGRNRLALRVQSWDPEHSKLLLSWRERYLTC